MEIDNAENSFNEVEDGKIVKKGTGIIRKKTIDELMVLL